MSGFLVEHAYLLLFIATLVAQLGLPVPRIPVLIAAGVLARSGSISVAAAMAVTVLASGLAHFVWYEAGRRRGTAVLRLLCKISIEPDSCVRRTEDVFVRYGSSAVIASAFVPGLAVVAPPLAGMSAVPIWRFLILDALGAVLFAGVFLAAGFATGPQLVMVLQVAVEFGTLIAVGGGSALGLWLFWKFAQRSSVIRALRIPRVEPADLAKRLAAADPPLVVDLRSELTTGGETIRGAHRILRDELSRWAEGVPRDREVILACD
jgi:membrane protein DedA with SNARE-associated domain